MILENRKELFIVKANHIHSNKYDYTKVVYKNAKTLVKLVCPIHGEFEQLPDVHLRPCGCPKCAQIQRTNKSQSSTQDFIKKANSIHNNRYSYNKVKYINAHKKVIIICKLHGEFEQTPNTHLAKHGCKTCQIEKDILRKTRTQEDFISLAIKKHKNLYDYQFSRYKNEVTPIKILCKTHGSFYQRPSVHLKGHGCPKCNNSKGEKEIRQYLQNNNVLFQEQISPILNHRHSFDFYLPDYDLYIEYQGEQHYFPVQFGGRSIEKSTIAFNEQQQNDYFKYKWCEENNHKLLEIKYTNLLNIDAFFDKWFGKDSFKATNKKRKK